VLAQLSRNRRISLERPARRGMGKKPIDVNHIKVYNSGDLKANMKKKVLTSVMEVVEGAGMNQ